MAKMKKMKASKDGHSSLLTLIQEKYSERRRHIVDVLVSEKGPQSEVDISQAYRSSNVTLPGYATLDWKHRTDTLRIIENIRKYARDRSLKRPLNIMMQAESGAGKSQLVKCMAKKLEVVQAAAVDFNMASFQSIEDMTQPLDAVRNLKVIDRLPILFLDEFDSDPERYALLLPLMWDGELHVGHRDLKLGKLVIILAGSGKTIHDAMKVAKGMQGAGVAGDGKLVDLLSRINGGELEIPSLDLHEGDRDRRADKACITISLLLNRFGPQVELVPWSLLRFVFISKFRYGVRSIAHLIDLVPPIGEDSQKIVASGLELPMRTVGELRNSSLAYHVFSEDGPAAIVEQWKSVQGCETLIRIQPEPEAEDVAA
jgi:hypothetical protein